MTTELRARVAEVVAKRRRLQSLLRTIWGLMDAGACGDGDAVPSSSASAKQNPVVRGLDAIGAPRVHASYRRLRQDPRARGARSPELNVDYKCSPPLQEDPRSTGRTVADSVSQQSTALTAAAAHAHGYRGLLTLMHARMTRKQRAQPISRAEIAALLSHELSRLDWSDLLGHLQADDERFEVQIATKRFEHAAQALSELAEGVPAASTGGAAAVPGELCFKPAAKPPLSARGATQLDLPLPALRAQHTARLQYPSRFSMPLLSTWHCFLLGRARWR